MEGQDLKTEAAAAPAAKYKIGKEPAEADFARLCDTWDIDTDTEEMDGDDRDSFAKLKRQIVRKIRTGQLTVDAEGETATLELEWSKKVQTNKITFQTPEGDAYATFDIYKDRQNVAKMHSLMGSMTGQGPDFFVKLNARDLKVCQNLVNLFLG